MSAPRLEDKDPSDIKDYGINWNKVLTAEGETVIDTSTWEQAPDQVGLSLLNSGPHAPYISGALAVVWVASGVAGTDYALINTIVTGGVAPRTHQRSIIIPCVER